MVGVLCKKNNINPVRVGIITINYNSDRLVKKFIQSLLKQSYDKWILVVVNNSDRDTNIKKVLKYFKENRIILLNVNKNIGYARANNLGFRYMLDKKKFTSRDIIFFSNPDIIIKDKNFIKEAIHRIYNIDLGFLGPRIVNNDGSLMLPHENKSNF